MTENEVGHRAYFFNNMYLSSIQQGIQVAHCLGEMVCKYRPYKGYEGNEYLDRWLKEDKTIVVLNAGYSSELIDLTLLFNMPENPYPWAVFKESAEALNCATTSVGIVLPYEIYEGAKHLNNPQVVKRTLGLPAAATCSGGEIGLGYGPTKAGAAGLMMYLPDGRDTPAHYSLWDVELMERMNQYRLAR